MDRSSGQLRHRQFGQLAEFLREGDLLIANDSRVIRARLRATKDRGGGKVEILLLRPIQANEWWVMLKPGKRTRAGTKLNLLSRDGPPSEVTAVVEEADGQGEYRLLFQGCRAVIEVLDLLGEVPLPPYIKRPNLAADSEDAIRYQTVFCKVPGSVAAPTAGLHFTQKLLDQIVSKGVGVRTITLHVGPGTFAPVKSMRVENHVMHSERFELDAETACAINETKARGGRVIAVGTTSLRTLESVARRGSAHLCPVRASTDIFIYPPFEFKIVDALITNFHLPESTLLMLVAAFVAPGSTKGLETILATYQTAIAERYRFFSYGDAMLIT